VKDSRFNELIDGYSSYVKYNAGTITGPFLSWNSLAGETKIWRNLCESLCGIKFYMNLSKFEGVAGKWSINDRMTGELKIKYMSDDFSVDESSQIRYKNCDFVPLYMGDAEILQKYVFKIKWEGQNIGSGVNACKDWKKQCKMYTTPAQKRWEVENGFCYDEEINRVEDLKMVPNCIKMWNRDLCNINLACCYKNEICRLCDEIIGSFHFIEECSNLALVEEAVSKQGKAMDISIVRYINWIANGIKKHEEVETSEAIIRATRKVDSMLGRWKYVKCK
jgi:hypothetical protein